MSSKRQFPKWLSSPRKRGTKEGKNMNKKDKKFIVALLFLHTGILIGCISLSGHYWHHSFAKLLKIQHLYEVSQMMKEGTNKAESHIKIKHLKKQYEAKGVGVEED